MLGACLQHASKTTEIPIFWRALEIAWMNEDAAKQILAKSKARFSDGDTSAAMRLVKKSIGMHDSQDAKDWLNFLNTQSNVKHPSSKQDGDINNMKQRTNAAKKSTATASSDSTASPVERPYTKEQVDGIARIKRSKAKGDLYAVLELEKNCSDSDLKKAYRRLALQFHPDKCSAPGTDEAFKAIGGSFAVLSDQTKRMNYDQYGIDSESRATSSGGGGASPFQGAQFQGFDGGDIDPAELFNMFFGQMAGGGNNAFGAANQGFQFNFGGPGFGNNRMRRQQRQRHQPEQPANRGFQCIQLIPFILMLILSLSSTFSGITDYTSYYALSKSYKFSHSRFTLAKNIPYYVSGRFNPSDTSFLKQVENSVEQDYIHTLQNQCWREREYQRQLIQRAQGWFSYDKDKLREAQEMSLPSCESLRKYV